MDVPYESKRYGHKHLSITVQEDGQIKQHDEAEAGFRLSSISKAPSPRDHGLPGAALSGTPATARPSARGRKRAGRRQAAAAAAPQGAARSPRRVSVRIRRWIWALAA